jgi:DegV family protein with EDD domain
MGKVRIVSDSTCDLSQELLDQYEIGVIPLSIVMDDKSYKDGVEVKTEEVLKWSNENKTTPKTSACNLEDAVEFLKPYQENGDEVIYIGISEDMSTTCNVMRLAADEMEYEGVHVINSMNLSTGIGLQVLRAADMAKAGKSAQEIHDAITAAREDVRASFVVDTLVFLSRGGRCSSVTALLASTLKIKPRIAVTMGKMGVSKKYHGNFKSAIMKYVHEMEDDLLAADSKRVFVTHSPMEDPAIVEEIKDYLKSLKHFDEILETNAGCVISSHCGPNCLGVLFYQK